MYAPAFDPTPQAGDMVVSRSDVKRRRKEGNILEESLQTSPKRTKVHAQRKFAQGSSNMSSPALTPVKDKDKVKTNGTVLSPELIPTKRPKTEDFLTFLCFRGTTILPPCLDFFNIATVQETQDEEQGSSMGDCSRESTRNSRIASASVSGNKLQRSDKHVADTSTSSGVIRKFERSENVRRRKPPTAVQALKKKYQEQRLAKQRASSLKKLAQKVKGKNMVLTRSAAHNKEKRVNSRTRGGIVKKTVRRMKIVQRKMKSSTKTDILNRNKSVVKRRNKTIRRDGLRSGGQLPPGSEAGLRSERELRQPEPSQPRFKPVVKKKIAVEKPVTKTFASSVSDFSSDDDQPLAKKMKPIDRASSSRQLARKVIKRIVSKRMKPRMITRSQQNQQQIPEKEQPETKMYTRPPRKTKEAAAIYMELLGRKLITPEAEVDEDSLSIDSFPELPNARRIERRESEIKARASKEKKEAELMKVEGKVVPTQKPKSDAENGAAKQKRLEIMRARKLSARSKRLGLQKQKNMRAVIRNQTLPSKTQDKTQDEGEKRLRPRKIVLKSQASDSNSLEEGDHVQEPHADKMKPPSVPRRSLRRGSRDATQSGTPSPDPTTSRSATNKKTKPLSPSPPPHTHQLRKSSKTPERSPSEDKFSDSDEEPLGKLALKQLTIKKTEGSVQDAKSVTKETSNKKVLKTEETAGLKVTDEKKKSSVGVKSEHALKVPTVSTSKGTEKKNDQGNQDPVDNIKKKKKKKKNENEISSKVKEVSTKRSEDDVKNKDKSCKKMDDSHQKDSINKKTDMNNKETSVKKIEDAKNEKKETSNKRNEENHVEIKENSPKRSEGSTKSKEFNKRNEIETSLEKKSEGEISPRRNRDVTISKNKDSAQRKCEDMTLKRGEEPLSKRKSNESEGKRKEMCHKNSEEKMHNEEKKAEEVRDKETAPKRNEKIKETGMKNKEVTNVEETSSKKKEEKPSEKKQPEIHYLVESEGSKKKEKPSEKKQPEIHSLVESEGSKKKELSSKKSENITGVVPKKNKVDVNVSKNEATVKSKRNVQKERHVDDVAHSSVKEDKPKDKGLVAAKTEVACLKSKEVTNEVEENKSTKKEILALCKKNDDTLKCRRGEIKEISPWKGDISQVNELSEERVELLKNSEKLSRKNEDIVQNKDLPAGKREELLKNSDKPCRKIEDPQPRQLLPGKEIKNLDKSSRKTEGKIELPVKKSEKLTVPEKNFEDKKVLQETKSKLSCTSVKPEKLVDNSSEADLAVKEIKEFITKNRDSSPQKDVRNKDTKQFTSELLSNRKLFQRSSPQKLVPKEVSDNVLSGDGGGDNALKLNEELKNSSLNLISSTILKIPDVPSLSQSGLRDSPKRSLDHSDSEDDIVLKKLAKQATLPVENEVPKPFSSSVKHELSSSEKSRYVGKFEIDSSNDEHLVTSRNVSISTEVKILKKDDTEVKDESIKLKRVESGPSSQSMGFCSKPDILLGREKGKSKVNMSNEQIEKWLNESYIDEADAKKDCQMFDKCLDPVTEQQEVDCISKEQVTLEGRSVLMKEMSLYPRTIGGNLYGCEKIGAELQQKTIDISKNVKSVTNEEKLNSPVKSGSPLAQESIFTTQNDSSSEKVGKSISAERKQSCTQEITNEGTKLISETKKHDMNMRHASASKSQSFQDRTGEKKSIFQQRRSFPLKAKERKDLIPSANAFSPENESSVYAFDSEPELPPISTPFRRRARDSRTSSTTTSKSEEDLARLDDEITPPQSVQPSQTVASSRSSPVIQPPSVSLPSYPLQPTQHLTLSQSVMSPTRIDSLSSVKSTQSAPSTQSSTLTQAVAVIQSPTPTESSSPPVQTESVPSTRSATITQSIPSTQSLILTQSVPTSQSQLIQSSQSERLPLPVLGQPIQTLPLATAVVQIIPTLPITMRSVPVENYVASQSQQQQQQQQLLLLQNDAVMTTLKTGSTSSTSIAVQVNLDSEVSPEVQVQEPGSMECSTQTDVAEEEEDDSEGHLFYIPLQQPPGKGGTLAAPSQQLIQGVAVKLGTEGPTGPNQRVIMRAKLVTKPPTFNRAPADTIGRSVLTRPTGMLMSEQKSVCATSTVTTGTYPPVGTVQPTARGRPLVTRSDATTDTVQNMDADVGKPTSPSKHTADISLGLYSQTEKPLAMVSAKPVSSKTQSPPATSSKFTGSKLQQQSTHGKERRGSTEVNSPSTSGAKSSSGTSKRGSQKYKFSSYICTPSNATNFPDLGSPAQMVEAPIFHPTEKEFQDPLEYIDRIRPVAEKFGLCRVVPPSNFKPECKVSDDMRFLAYNQYVHKMLHRWGPNVKEMMAIKKYLATQSICFNHPPWIGGMEVDLPRLYKIVQGLGGLKEVIEKKKWQRVADGMKIPKSAQERVTKLDDIYCKYLLPYDTLSPDERQKLFDDVEKEWVEREKRAGSSTPTGGSDVTEEDCETDTTDENEECIVKGRNMPLNAFYRIARNTMSMWFRQSDPPATEVEQEFWRHVTLRQSHVCVHSGSIDSSGWGYGFPCSKNSPFARHPWNLKVLTNNSGSILRSIGPIMGVTVPTLHVGMLFTTCCWYRDPHGLPWVEYLHTGASKIWYGIPDEYSAVFRSALTKLVPRYVKNKTIWLPSDTAMVPPPMLVKHGVSLCHTVQEPGQFILVFPRAFTSSICTGYLVSESVYFAQPNWLNTAEQVFKDTRDSCEPSMFSLERLLFSIATDGRTNVEVLKQILPMVLQIRQQELEHRKQLYALGLKTSERLPLPEAHIKRRKARQAREEEGDYECEMCRANLFVSLVTNSHEEGVYCLPHAIQLLTKKRHHLKYCKLMYTYDQAELNELIQKLEEKIETKSQRKSQGKATAAQKP